MNARRFALIATMIQIGGVSWCLAGPVSTGIVNGSFETPANVQSYIVFGAGTALSGWTVESGTVEVVGPYWQAAKGSQSLDLNGIYEEIGTIYQDVPTEPGRAYRLRFAYAGNPEGGPVVKTMRVSWNDTKLADLRFDTTGRTVTNMGWRYQEFVIRASTTTARIRFQSTCQSFCGPTLDDVTLVPMDGPPPPPPPPPPHPPHPPGDLTKVTNGGFEDPSGVQTYTVFGPGTGLPGWTVESGTVEVVGPYWQAAKGSQSLDLNGIYEQTGTIYQDVETTAGHHYLIRFAFSGNPEGDPAVKSMKVFWNGNQLAEVEFDTTGHTNANMGWRYHEFEVTATGATSRLRFQSTSSSFCGPALDDVSVIPAPPRNGPRMQMQPGDHHDLVFHADAGAHYRIEYCDSLTGGQWKPMRDVTLSNTSDSFNFTDPGAGTVPQRFYRAVRVP